MTKKLSRTQYELLGIMAHGGALTGRRTYPGPWHYKTGADVEYSSDAIIALVCGNLLTAKIDGPDVIKFAITDTGKAAEKDFATHRQDKRQRGAG